MTSIRFLPKVVTICFEKEIGFDCKNNNGRGKLANFRLDIISKINYKTLVVILYTSSWLRLRKVKLVQRNFK